MEKVAAGMLSMARPGSAGEPPAVAAIEQRLAVAQMPVTPADAAHAGRPLGKPFGAENVPQSGK